MGWGGGGGGWVLGSGMGQGWVVSRGGSGGGALGGGGGLGLGGARGWDLGWGRAGRVVSSVGSEAGHWEGVGDGVNGAETMSMVEGVRAGGWVRHTMLRGGADTPI